MAELMLSSFSMKRAKHTSNHYSSTPQTAPPSPRQHCLLPDSTTPQHHPDSTAPSQTAPALTAPPPPRQHPWTAAPRQQHFPGQHHHSLDRTTGQKALPPLTVPSPRQHHPYWIAPPPRQHWLTPQQHYPLVNKQVVCILLEFFLVTARKWSLQMLCFYTCLSFCPQGGVGVFAPVHAGMHTPHTRGRHPPSRQDQRQPPPWNKRQTPRDQRQTLPPGWD